MAIVKLHPNYIRKLAQSYRLLRSGEQADAQVLEAVQRAAERCLQAHMRAELELTADVRLPLATVLMMLQYVRQACADRLADVPTPETMAPTPSTPERQHLLQRMFVRFQQLVAA